MVVRVAAAPTTGSIKTANYCRVTALDKCKTDWFHEVSNLFTVTTDQVVGCNDTCQNSQNDTNSNSMYQARMLQNRAKLGMVISMVERYMKGKLSVDRGQKEINNRKVSNNETKSDFSPWTMISPNEVCPGERHLANEEDADTLKEKFTLDEALENLCPDNSRSDSDVHQPQGEELEKDFSMPSSDTAEQTNEDILAQACEVINRYGIDNSKTDAQNQKNSSHVHEVNDSRDSESNEINITDNQKANSTFHKNNASSTTPKLIYVRPNNTAVIPIRKFLPSVANNNQKAKLIRTVPTDCNTSIKSQSQIKPLRILQSGKANSTVTSGGHILLLAPNRKPQPPKNSDSLKSAKVSIANSVPAPENKCKVVDVIPATLPDGRVVNLEIAQIRPRQQHQISLATSQGVKHVILPRRVSTNYAKRPLTRLTNQQGEALVLQRATSPLTLNPKPYIQKTQSGVCHLPTQAGIEEAKDATNLPGVNPETVFTNEIPTQPGSDISCVNEISAPCALSSREPENVEDPNERECGMTSTNHSAASVITPLVISTSRKRTHNGEVKLVENVGEYEKFTPPTIVNISGADAKSDGGESLPSPKVHIDANQVEPDAECNDLSTSLLDELMEQLPSPSADEDFQMLSEDMFDYFLPETTDPQVITDPVCVIGREGPGFVTETETPSVTVVPAASAVSIPGSLKAIAEPTISLVHSGSQTRPLQEYTVQLTGSQTSFLKTVTDCSVRKVLSTINGNEERLKLQTDNCFLPKAKRKYSKSNETKSKTSQKPLGPTAAAAAKNPYHKPPLPYNILIYLAFKDASFTALSVKKIYSFILKTFPYYKHAHSTWQNAIRHQLCCCKVYEKVPEISMEQGEERPTGKSAWRVLNNECVRKLTDDAVCAVAKKDSEEKIRLALANQDDFHLLFADIFEMVNGTVPASIQKIGVNSQTILQNRGEPVKMEEVSIQLRPPVDSWLAKSEQNILEISPPTSCESSTGEEDDGLIEEIHSYSSLFFDVSNRSHEVSSIFNV